MPFAAKYCINIALHYNTKSGYSKWQSNGCFLYLFGWNIRASDNRLYLVAKGLWSCTNTVNHNQTAPSCAAWFEHQGDHSRTMKNPEVLADMRATEETMMIFSNSLDPNETPCDTASHCDPCCLTIKTTDLESIFKTGKIRRSPEIRRNGRTATISPTSRRLITQRVALFRVRIYSFPTTGD